MEKYEAMSDKQKKATLRDAVKMMQDDEVVNVKRENMENIVNDIEVIFEKYDIVDAMTEAGEKPRVGTPINGDEPPKMNDPENMDDDQDLFKNGGR